MPGSQSGAPPSTGERGRKKRTPTYHLRLWIPARETPAKMVDGKKVRKRYRRPGYFDVRVRRRHGPLCEKCKRRHYPFQGCWTGPETRKRQLKAPREHKRALEESAKLRATVPDPAAAVVFRDRPAPAPRARTDHGRPEGGFGAIRPRR